MPKRTNQFQQVVAYITEKLAPLGARVRESAMVAERGAPTILREVDTLLEVGGGIVGVRIAVEARARGRKDDVQWIDSLIGKYNSLQIDRVIAVSRSGFTPAAAEKAALHGIEVLSPQEVKSVDWPSKFMKLGVASIVRDISFTVELVATPAISRALCGSDQLLLLDDESELAVSWEQFLTRIRPRIVEKIVGEVGAKFMSQCNTLDDLSKLAAFEGTFPANSGQILVSVDDICHAVTHIHYHGTMHQSASVLPVTHELLHPDALLSTTTVQGVAMVIAQTASSGQAKVFLESAQGAAGLPAGKRARRSRREEP